MIANNSMEKGNSKLTMLMRSGEKHRRMTYQRTTTVIQIVKQQVTGKIGKNTNAIQINS